MKNGWLRRLWPFLARHKRKVFTAFGVSLGTTIITVLIPLIERSVVDNVIVEQSQALWPLLVLLVGLGAVNFVLSYIRRFVGGRFAFDVQHDLRTTIFERVQRLDFARHDQLPTGQVVSRASSDLALVQTLLSFLPLATGNVVLLVLSLVVMLVLSPLLTLIVLAIVPALLFVSLRLRRVMFPAQWDSLQRAGEVAGVVDEAVSGVRVVKGFGQEDRELAGLTDAAEGLYRSRVRTVRLQARYQSALQAIPALGQVGVLALGGWLAIEGQISIGTFLAFSTYLGAAPRAGAHVRRDGGGRRAGARRHRADLRADRLEPTRHRAARRAAAPGDHAPRSPSSTSATGTCARNRCCATSRSGWRRARRSRSVGASGSGKSTVSLLLPRFYDVQDGSIRIDGVDVRDVTLDSVRREIGIVFEDAFLFSDTVRTNIAYGRPDASDDDVERAARIAGAHEFVDGAPARLRHRGRRTRAHALRRSTPAHLHRACGAHRPSRARARRRHVVGRHAHRGADPRHAARDHGRPHDGAHRPPALDPAPGRPHRAGGGRPGCGERHPRGAAGVVAARTGRCSTAPATTSRTTRWSNPTATRPDASGVTASLWDRTAEAEAVRAFVAPAGPAVARRRLRAAAARPARGVGGGHRVGSHAGAAGRGRRAAAGRRRARRRRRRRSRGERALPAPAVPASLPPPAPHRLRARS